MVPKLSLISVKTDSSFPWKNKDEGKLPIGTNQRVSPTPSSPPSSSRVNLQVRLDQGLAQLDVLLLGVGLRGAGVDDLLPSLALGLALVMLSVWTCDG